MKKGILSIVFFLLLINSTNAQWDGNPGTVNNPITTTKTVVGNTYSVTDGAGGIIVVWASNDGAGNNQIYIQRKSSAGQIIWGDVTAPVEIYATSNASFDETTIDDIEADGLGGAYISWEDEPGDSVDVSNAYLQHINSSGQLLLASNGVKINLANGHYNYFAKLSVNALGVIACWTDEQDDPTNDSLINVQLFVQRYNTSDQPQWGAGGVQVCTAPGPRANADIVTDGSNGAIIGFSDGRNGQRDTSGDYINVDLYAQRISSSGARLWTNNGVLVSNQPYNQEIPDYSGNIHSMVSDGVGGAIINFESFIVNDSASINNFYVQRLNSSGALLWPTAAVAISTGSSSSKQLDGMVSDSANGAVMLWDEYTSSYGDSALIAQRVTSAGTIAWGTSGVLLNNPSTGLLNYGQSAITGDGTGNFVISWPLTDINTSNRILAAQKLNSAGVAQWAGSGVDGAGINVCTVLIASPSFPSIVKSDGSNVIVVWDDQRLSDIGTTIFAAKITSSGSLVTSSAYITTADGNWNVPATWIGGVVPPAGVDVIVKNKVVGNLTTTCNSLTVESPGSLTVNTGIKITILH